MWHGPVNIEKKSVVSPLILRRKDQTDFQIFSNDVNNRLKGEKNKNKKYQLIKTDYDSTNKILPFSQPLNLSTTITEIPDAEKDITNMKILKVLLWKMRSNALICQKLRFLRRQILIPKMSSGEICLMIFFKDISMKFMKK